MAVKSKSINEVGDDQVDRAVDVLEHYSNLETAIAIFSSNAIAARKGLAEKDGVKAGAAKF